MPSRPGGRRPRPPTPAVDPAKEPLIAALRARLATAHHLDGATLVAPDGLPAFGFQLSHGSHESPTPGAGTDASVIAIGHDDGPRVGMFVFASRPGPVACVARLDPHSDVADALLARREAHFVMFRRSRCVSTGVFEWPEEHPMWTMLNYARREPPVLPPIVGGHLMRSKMLERLLTQDDRAAAGWMELWDNVLADFEKNLGTVREMLRAASIDAATLAEPFDRIVHAILVDEQPLRAIVPIVIAEVEQSAGARLLRRSTEEPEAVDRLGAMLVPLIAESPPATRQGRAFSAITWRSPNFEIVSVPLDLDAIESKVGLGEFWKRMPSGGRLHWNRFVRGDDIPAPWEALEEGFQAATLTDDAEEARATATALLEEATRDRQWTIPPRAVVDFRVGPFVRAEVVDLASHVVFTCRTPRWEYHPIILDVRTGHMIEGLTELFRETGDAERAERLDATMHLLLASIVRDFLVVEDRASVFRQVTEPIHRTAKGQGSSSGSVIVYLPRVRYAARPDVGRLVRDLAVERRAHDVAAHLRRSPRMSPTQRALAEYHGWTIPDGFTYVRPHRRGDREVDVIYRSRSALQALYEISEPGDTATSKRSDDWFAFERAVRELVRDRGLRYEEVQPLGDAGIAVLAVDDADHEHGLWLIHALRGERIGPGHVERHAAALANAPEGTRGLLVTDGVLTDAARAAAVRAGLVVADVKRA